MIAVSGKEVHVSVGAEAAVPPDFLHQLRLPVADFVGREAEIAELMEKIAERGATISGVQGMGGVGKTELALVLADRLKPRYPDGQFYLDLRGTSPKPLRATEALAHVIRGFHPEEKLPEDEGQLRGLYQSVLHGKRVLLLMDNAAEAEQVEPLIPPAGCVLLVTSRQHFTLPGLFAKNLDTLPPAEARELLLRIAGRIGGCADEIAKLCGYLPLALRLAGSALAERPALSPDDYVQRLTDEQRRLEHLDKVDASLCLSDALLDAELRRLWYALAVFPADFDRAAAAAVWQLDADQAQDALDKLVRYSVLEWNQKTGRFRLHDLVRLLANRRLTDSDRAASELRHAIHYAEVAASADGKYLQGGQDVAKGLALFDLEWPNIKAGFGWARAHAATEDTAAILCSAYTEAGPYCLNLRQRPLEQIAWFEDALAAARRLHDRAAEGGHLGNLGNAYLTLGQPRRAIEFYEQQLVIKREIGERRGEGNALGNLGNAYRDLGEPRRAIEFYEQCLTIHRKIGDRRGEGNDVGNLGTAYAALGQPRRAIEFYEQSLTIHREIGERRGEGSSLGNLGRAYAALGQHRRAIEFYEQRMEVAREMGDRRAEGIALADLGNAHGDLGEPRRAIEFHEQDLEIAREIGDRHGEGSALGNLGNAYASLGESRRAIELYEEQLAITREIGDRRGEANASWNLGVVLEQQGDLARAVELMQVCVDYEREIGHADAEEHAAHVETLRARMGA